MKKDINTSLESTVIVGRIYGKSRVIVRLLSLLAQRVKIQKSLLMQIKGEDVNNYDYLILCAEICYNTCFSFFGIPAGDYELTIKAQGYKFIEKKYSVMPGIIEYFRITELAAD